MNGKTLLAVAVTLLFWSSAFAGLRVGLQGGYTAGHLVLLRFLSASLVFVLYGLVTKLRLPDKADIARIALLGVIGITIYHTSLTFGENTVPAGTASLIIAAAPTFTALIAAVVLKEHLRWIGWLGMAVGFGGITLITFGSHQAHGFTRGALLILLSALCTSIFFVFQKPLFKKYRPIELTAYFTFAGTIPLLVFLPGFFHQLTTIPVSVTMVGVYVGVFPAAVAYVSWAIALSTGRAGVVTSSLYFNPVLAILIAWLWIGELPQTISIVGGILAVIGVMIVNLWGTPKAHVKSNSTAQGKSGLTVGE